MRLWSIHPGYLDAKGLVALWREALLAKKVLEGHTKGYRHHPQLKRFRESENADACINNYLKVIHSVAVERGYNFDPSRFTDGLPFQTLTVTEGQVEFERAHLLGKLKTRDPVRYRQLSAEPVFRAHPLFTVIRGPVEDWEIT
jgi:hypothetical protein